MLKNQLQIHLKLQQKDQLKKSKNAGWTGDLISNKITNKITKNSPRHNSLNKTDSQTEKNLLKIPKVDAHSQKKGKKLLIS